MTADSEASSRESAEQCPSVRRIRAHVEFAAMDEWNPDTFRFELAGGGVIYELSMDLDEAKLFLGCMLHRFVTTELLLMGQFAKAKHPVEALQEEQRSRAAR